MSTPSPVAVATDSPPLPTLTAVPTATPSAAPTNPPTNTSAPSPTATQTSTVILPPTTEPPLVNDSPGTAGPDPTREPWPTTSPALLRKPPADLDVSQTHLWFTRPVDGNNVPSTPYGNFMPGTQVNLECSDATPRRVETYWDQYTPPDDILAENFAISDLPAGTCRVWADLSGEVVEQFVEIRPGELSMIMLQARP